MGYYGRINLYFLLLKYQEDIMLQFLLTISDEASHRKIENIYNTYHIQMMRYAISKFQSLGRTNFLYDAEDAVQNAFIKITKYIDNIDFNREEKDVKNYVFSVLHNEINNLINNDEENFEFFEEFCKEKEYNFIEELEIRENYDEIVKAIEKLDERYSITLFLVFCKEMTVNEIAEMMGIGTKTVYTRLARGKKLLLDSLKGAKFNGEKQFRSF